MFIEQRENLAAGSGGATCSGWLTIDHAIHFALLELWILSWEGATNIPSLRDCIEAVFLKETVAEKISPVEGELSFRHLKQNPKSISGEPWQMTNNRFVI